MAMLDTNKVKELQDVLNNAQISAEVWEHPEFPIIYARIEDGDWHHDHTIAKNVAKDVDLVFLRYEDYKACEDGETFSATHVYTTTGFNRLFNGD